MARLGIGACAFQAWDLGLGVFELSDRVFRDLKLGAW
jgi:hypothetical protein